MTDYVFKSPDLATLVTEAHRLGFADKDGNILVSGPTHDGGGYFINIVGTIYQPTGSLITDSMGNQVPELAPVPGYWGRLRVNGDTKFVPKFDPVITVYIYVADLGWTNDGVTLAPAYVQDVGLIA